MAKKVIVAGHICLDITPVFSSERAGALEEMLTPSKLVRVGQADIHTGGCVANTGLAMKFFGADVLLIGKTGNDQFGKIIIDMLDKYDASGSMIVTDEASTSYTIVIAPPGIDRIFLHNTGANDDFSADDISDDLLEGVSLFHFGYPPLLKNFYENDGAELVRLFKRIKEHNIATSLDMAAVDPQSDAAKADWVKILQNIMPYVDFFLPSVEELCFMLDRDKLSDWSRRAGGKEITSILSIKYDIMPMADRLMDMGGKVLLIKCGASGMYYRTAPTSALESVGSGFLSDPGAWADREGFEKSYEPEKVLSGTGAGDTSVAAFLTAAIRGYDLSRCLRLATAAGASCVEGYDALSGLKTFEEYEKKITSGWKKRE